MKVLAILAFLSALVAFGSAVNRVCYFASWTIYRQGNGKFQASDVDPNLCTHILFAFFGLGEDGGVNLLDDWEANGLHEIDNLMALKSANPDLKIIASMGGWNEGSTKYSQVFSNPSLRSTVVANAQAVLDQYGFDGFDLDWEYPNQRGGVPDDVENFVAFLGELKSALNANGKIVSVAVAGAAFSIDLSYNIPEVSNNVDMINVMTYDYHGSFESFIGHYAPLTSSSLDTEDQKQLNVDAGIQYWISKGVDKSKLNVGIGTYGRGFTMQNDQSDLNSPTNGPSQAGPYTNAQGTIGYNEICELYLATWERVWDDEQQVPHIVGEGQWIGYDDEQSVALKAQYARDNGLGGYMIWSLDTDDFMGNCGNGKNPLLNAMKNAWP